MKMPGREIDKYDLERQKYFSLSRAQTTMPTKRRRTSENFESKRITMEPIWGPVRKEMNLFSNLPPLLDNTHTPRSRTKIIALDRTKESKVWIPNNKTLNEFKLKERR